MKEKRFGRANFAKVLNFNPSEVVLGATERLTTPIWYICKRALRHFRTFVCFRKQATIWKKATEYNAALSDNVFGNLMQIFAHEYYYLPEYLFSLFVCCSC